ncbi:MAG: glycosyltransferase family 4 protein [Eubacterium sp.]|nr:glycosyltransferase family 4 protein [Eubacterium sp.]
MKRMAVISAGFVPVPAVDGGAGEVLTTEIINGNELTADYFMDIYTIESPKLDKIDYKNAEIIQIHISKINWFLCKARNAFLKLFRKKYRFIPYNRELLRRFKDNYDMILIENNMQVFEDICNRSKNGTNHMIYHMHNDIDGTTKPEYLCKYIADKAEVILPVSEYLKDHFMQVAPNDKMKVFYNCVDLEKFNTEKVTNTKALKRKYNINKSDFVYMYTGRVCPEKGILELVKAFKKISKENPNSKLMVVGSRWYNQIAKDEYFEKLLKEAEGLEEKIIFTGYIFPEDMPSIYTLADVLVIPSMWEEPFGVVALEGMAMKLPIITTNSGGLIEILDKETSIIVDKSRDVEEQLYTAMITMWENAEKRENIAQNAYTKLIETFAFNKKNYYDEFKKRIEKCR